MFDGPIQNAIEQFAKLPGIGERTALRLVLHLIAKDKSLGPNLSGALQDLENQITECDQCHMLTVNGPLCNICQSQSRNSELLCVVAQVQDLIALESTHEFRGFYHVLHGVLAPMEGIGPNEIRVSTLLERLKRNSIQEVILATPPTVEGEATALYLAQELQPFRVQVTRIASGVPVGGDLQFSDRLTLSRAVQLRRSF